MCLYVRFIILSLQEISRKVSKVQNRSRARVNICVKFLCYTNKHLSHEIWEIRFNFCIQVQSNSVITITVITLITNKITSHFWSQMTGYKDMFHGYNESRLYRTFFDVPRVFAITEFDCITIFTNLSSSLMSWNFQSVYTLLFEISNCTQYNMSTLVWYWWCQFNNVFFYI